MKNSHVIGICALLSALAFTGAAGGYSQEKKDAGEAHKIVHFGDLKWTPIIKGCDVASVDGDMNAEGTPFVLRLRCADGSKIPAHWHPRDENIVVLKGIFSLGAGDRFDTGRMQDIPTGGYGFVPGRMNHFALCKGETDILVYGIGPRLNNWVSASSAGTPSAGTKPVAR